MSSLKSKLPNTITLVGLAGGFWAILNFEKYFVLSFVIILISMMLDFLDGYLARRLKVESPLGQKLDSLLDTTIYLIYPALVLRQIAPENYYFLGIILIFLLAGAWRLARQNLIVEKENKFDYYTGLPVCFSLCLILLIEFFPQMKNLIDWQIWSVLLLLLSGLMISSIRFPKPKQIWPWLVVFLFIIIALVWRTGV
jgi:CDP-diacylglycerol--serine O-phosphatidyltransferase